MINIFAYVVGERHYGYIPYSTQWGTDKNKENAKNACSKRVKCLNDYSLIGKTFTVTAQTENSSKSITVEVISL